MLVLSRPRWNVLLVATMLVGSLFIVVTRVRPDAAVLPSGPRGAVASTPAPLANHPAPDFTLVDLAGTPMRLADLRGQVVLVNVWATWCPPCRAEMPMLQVAYEQYRAPGLHGACRQPARGRAYCGPLYGAEPSDLPGIA